MSTAVRKKEYSRDEVKDVIVTILKARSIEVEATQVEIGRALMLRHMARPGLQVLVVNRLHGSVNVLVENTVVGGFNFIAEPKNADDDGEY